MRLSWGLGLKLQIPSSIASGRLYVYFRLTLYIPWTGCEAVRVPHGTVDAAEFDETRHLVCDSGHKLTSIQERPLLCHSDGVFYASDSTPRWLGACAAEPKDCDNPATPVPHGTVNLTSTEEGKKTWELFCEPGYRPMRPDLVYVCDDQTGKVVIDGSRL